MENGNQDSVGPSIMKEEIKLAIKELKCNKTVEIDNINGMQLLMALERAEKSTVELNNRHL